MNAAETEPPPAFELAAYLRRIEHHGPVEPDLPTLRALHLAHATHIPFENLDILLQRPIRLDLASLQSKLVHGGRGGYCFEQNTLFAAALRALGFQIETLIARVRFRVTQMLPRTHMLLAVSLGSQRWLCDVGFGADGLLLPVALGSGEVSDQFAWQFRAIERSDGWAMQALHDGDWEDLYAFTLEPQFPVDFEVANHYTSTHPESRFGQLLVAQRLTPEAKIRLRNRELTHDTGRAIERQWLTGDDELLQVLDDTFGLRFEHGTRFHYGAPDIA